MDFSDYKIQVTLNEAYADIEEEALIYVRGSAPSSTVINALEIFGDISFPSKSSVVGLYLWNGTQILKGKLKSTTQAISEYEAVVDRNEAPPPMPRDPALLTRLNSNNYLLNIYPATFNSYRKIRIRYLVPVNQLTSQLELKTVLGGDLYPTASVLVKGLEGDVVIQNGESQVPIEMPGQISLAQLNVFSIKVPSLQSHRRAIHTSFSTGEWKGHYTLMDLPIPDSLIRMANYEREVVVLWKWNFTENFKDQDGALTNYGLQAVEQAELIASAMENSTSGEWWYNPRDYLLKWGLLLQAKPGQRIAFPCAAYGETQFTNTTRFLRTLRSQLDDYIRPRPTKTTKASNQEIEAIKNNGRSEFDTLMQQAVTLFSPEQGIIKHIIVITAGPDFRVSLPGYTDLKEYALAEGITMSGAYATTSQLVYGAWPGVNLDSVAIGKEYSGPLEQISSLPVPQSRELNYSVGLRWNGINQYYEVNPYTNFHLSLHDTVALDSVLTWRAFEQNGTEIGRVREVIPSLARAADSGIVKIFAADLNARSTQYSSSYFGPTFGVVRMDYALVALESDTIGDSLSRIFENQGLPHLQPSEIFLPVVVEDPGPIPVKVKPNHKLRLFFRSPGVLVVEHAPWMGQHFNIEVLDMRGRVVARGGVQQEDNAIKEQVFNLGHLQAGIYIVRVRGVGLQVVTKSFVMR